MNCKSILNWLWGAIKERYKMHKAYYNAIRILYKSGCYIHVNLERAEWINHIAEHTTMTVWEADEIYPVAHSALGLSKEDIVRIYPNDGTGLYRFKELLLRGECL